MYNCTYMLNSYQYVHNIEKSAHTTVHLKKGLVYEITRWKGWYVFNITLVFAWSQNVTYVYCSFSGLTRQLFFRIFFLRKSISYKYKATYD